jgi:hypothetical protein
VINNTSPWIKNELGSVYGRLTVIGLHEQRTKSGQAQWICACTCGNTYIVEGRSLRSGRTKSCGCLNNEKRAERAGRATDAWRLPTGLASFRVVLRNYRHSAKLRNIHWNLDENDAYDLMQSNCFYCGVEPGLVEGSPRYNGTFVHGGIDRWNNSMGYSKENCVPCCETCNKAKLDMTAEDFITWLLRASEYLRENIGPRSAR